MIIFFILTSTAFTVLSMYCFFFLLHCSSTHQWLVSRNRSHFLNFYFFFFLQTIGRTFPTFLEIHQIDFGCISSTSQNVDSCTPIAGGECDFTGRKREFSKKNFGNQQYKIEHSFFSLSVSFFFSLRKSRSFRRRRVILQVEKRNFFEGKIVLFVCSVLVFVLRKVDLVVGERFYKYENISTVCKSIEFEEWKGIWNFLWNYALHFFLYSLSWLKRESESTLWENNSHLACYSVFPPPPFFFVLFQEHFSSRHQTTPTWALFSWTNHLKFLFHQRPFSWTVLLSFPPQLRWIFRSQIGCRFLSPQLRFKADVHSSTEMCRLIYKEGIRIT